MGRLIKRARAFPGAWISPSLKKKGKEKKGKGVERSQTFFRGTLRALSNTRYLKFSNNSKKESKCKNLFGRRLEKESESKNILTKKLKNEKKHTRCQSNQEKAIFQFSMNWEEDWEDRIDYFAKTNELSHLF